MFERYIHLNELSGFSPETTDLPIHCQLILTCLEKAYYEQAATRTYTAKCPMQEINLFRSHELSWFPIL